ncbi:MAG: hypothetical protein ACLR2E_07130 [Lachnospiraceae bacterium]
MIFSLRYITLLNCTGRYEEALDALQTRKFHPLGGRRRQGKRQYHRALLSLALKALEEKAGQGSAPFSPPAFPIRTT